MKRLAGRVHMEGRGLFAVERTQGTERRARALEREIRTDDLDDVIRLGHALDGFL
jgi:hypothetical protein